MKNNMLDMNINESVDLRGNDIGFQILIHKALDNIMKIPSIKNLDERSINLDEIPIRIGYAVSLLAAILSPYADDIYKDQIKKLLETKIDDFMYNIKKLEYVCQLCGRHGWLIEREGADRADADISSSYKEQDSSEMP